MAGSNLIQEEGIELSRIESVLGDESRVNVEHSYSFHNMVEVGEGIRLHAVLKFKYSAEHIESVFGAKKPQEDTVKEYGTANRLFPYCIFNSIDEVPLSWTYQNKDGRVYERIEVLVTVTDVKYMKYFPYELRLLSLKVGTDGTAKTGLVNLRPELQQGTWLPNVDFGVFTKTTSALRIGPRAVENGDVICRMVMRDLRTETLGNLQGLYTRVYTVFFFTTPPTENLCKFVLLCMVMTNLSSFLPLLEMGDMLAIVLTIVLTQIALLFVMPHNQDFTLAETVISAHAIYVLLLGIFIAVLLWLEEEMIMTSYVVVVNVAITVMTVAYVARQRWKFLQLVQTIKRKFQGPHPLVGSFTEIDAQI